MHGSIIFSNHVLIYGAQSKSCNLDFDNVRVDSFEFAANKKSSRRRLTVLHVALQNDSGTTSDISHRPKIAARQGVLLKLHQRFLLYITCFSRIDMWVCGCFPLNKLTRMFCCKQQGNFSTSVIRLL